MKRLLHLILFLSLMAVSVPLGAEPLPPGFVFQVFGGAPLNFSTTLEIDQQGEPGIEHEADWSSKPFEQPFYWALRARWQRDTDGFEIQLLHHKMYLDNPPATIEHFEVTHGFNILTFNYLRRTRPVHWRIGAGVTMPNTFATVRGELSDEHDYSIGGPAVLAGLGGELPLAGRLHLAGDVQFIAARGVDDVAGGEARVTSLAFHFLLGLGYVF